MANYELMSEVREYLGEEQYQEILQGTNSFRSEFLRAAPKDNQELLDFYKTSRGYLTANAQHVCPPELLEWKKGRVLDFGGGAGTHSFPIAMNGLFVDYCDISTLQQAFIKWLAQKYSIESNLKVVSEPIGEYDYIIMADVIEHLADYRPIMKEVLSHLKLGGLAFLKPQFDEVANGEMRIHFGDEYGFEAFVKSLGMEKIENGLIWRKK